MSAPDPTRKAWGDLSVLVVAPPYQVLPAPGYGGIERVVVERVQRISELGARVDVAAPAGSKVPGATHHIEFQKVDPYFRKHGASPLAETVSRSSSASTLNYWWSYRSVDGRGYDCIIDDAFRAEPWNFIPSSLRWRPDRTLHILHANPPPWARWQLAHMLGRMRFGALNQDSQAVLLSHGWSSHLLPNGINVPPAGSVCRSPSERLIFVGRVVPEKGVHDAIRLARQLSMPLDIVGTASDEIYFDEAVRPAIRGEEVTFSESIPRQVLESKLRRAAALVFTSAWPDPYPTVVLEALSFGVPVVGLTPPPMGGWGDVCTPRNSLLASSVDGLVKRFGRIRSLDREEIQSNARASLDWGAVLVQKYLPAIREMCS